MNWIKTAKLNRKLLNMQDELFTSVRFLASQISTASSESSGDHSPFHHL